MATAAGISDFNVDFMDRALALLCKYKSTPSLALAEFTKSTPEQLKLVSWTAREIKALEAAVKDASLDLKQVKKVVPTKNYADIVRAYYGWKGWVLASLSCLYVDVYSLMVFLLSDGSTAMHGNPSEGAMPLLLTRWNVLCR